MNITPRDILEKEFSKKMNGYDPAQVDEFLDDIIKQFESLMEENEDVIAKNESLKSEVTRHKQKADKLEDVEDKMMQTVIAAQRNASMYIDKAEVQAQKIIDTANQNAKTVMESTYLRMEAAQKELKKYESIIADYKKQFKLFLDEQAAHAEARLDKPEEVAENAADLSRSINNLTQQMKELDGDPQADSQPAYNPPSYSADNAAPDYPRDYPNYDGVGDTRVNEGAKRFGPQDTADLQAVVNDVIND